MANNYEIKNIYQGGYSSLNPNKSYNGGNFTGYHGEAGKLSITTDPRTANILKEVTSKLSGGLKQMEVVLLSPTMDMIPKQHLQEVNRLSKLTGIDLTVHGPVIDVSGLTQQGFDEFNRQASERTIISALERSNELNPEGNINVTFHTSEGIPGSEWKTLGEKGKPREYGKMVVVDKSTGQMVTALKDEIRYRPGGEKGYTEEARTPEKLLENANATRWDDELNKVIFQKEMGDRILSETYPAARKIYAAVSQNEDLFKQLPKEQQQVLLNVRVADEHLRDTQQSITSLFSKAYEYGNDEVRKQLANAGKNFEKNLIGFDKDQEKLSREEQQMAAQNYNDLQNRSRALQLFAQEIKGINPNLLVPLEEFALEKSSKTFGNAAFAAFKKFGDKAPIISIENPPVGHALSTGEDLKNLIEGSRKEFSKKLIESEHMSEKEAQKYAEKLIGATWDVGHINMLRKQGFGKEEIIAESAKIKPYLKHVHLSDNFGLEHTELPMGMGNVPFKEIMDKLGKEGFEAKKVVEASSWWQHFQTNPAVESLEGLGASLYANSQTPYWNQSLGFYQGYQSGLEGAWLPGNNYQNFGTYFSQLPTELGGNMQSTGGRMSGKGME